MRAYSHNEYVPPIVAWISRDPLFVKADPGSDILNPICLHLTCLEARDSRSGDA